MIVYAEDKKYPIFAACFQAEGQPLARQHRSSLACNYDLFLRHIPRRLISETLLYAPLPDDEMNDPVIVFDNRTTSAYLNWLLKQYPDRRIILWLWNKISDPDRFSGADPSVEIWSYHPDDCRRYGLRYNPQFFFDSLCRFRQDDTPSADGTALFIGRKKHRTHLLHLLTPVLREAGLTPDYSVISRINCRLSSNSADSFIPYAQTVERAAGASVILDLTDHKRTGPSLRVMESLFLDKKLITNNALVGELDFYNSSNILVLDHSEPVADTIRKFLSIPFIPAAPSVKDKYLFSSWLGRIRRSEAEPLL